MTGPQVLIPAYGAAASIGKVLEGVRVAVPSLPVLVVDDGSRDATAEAARAAGAEVLSHPANRGKGAALRTGFEAALARGASGVLTLDADGQHPPGLLPRFLEASASADLVLGCRMDDAASMPWLRLQANRLASRLVSARAGTRIRDSQCGYRWISAEVLRRVDLRTERYETESELLILAARAGFRIVEIPVPAVYAGERSGIRKIPDSIRFLRMLSSLPLQSSGPRRGTM